MKCSVNGFGVCVPLVGAASPRCKYCSRSMLEGVRDGATFDRDRDGARLNAQAQRVFDAMRDGEWHTPEELERLTGDNWASVSARARDFRKSRYGGFTVERRSVGHGLWEYRLLLPVAEEVA